jgi:hypothetical protein
MLPIVQDNIKTLQIVAVLAFPEWFNHSDYNFDGITKEAHQYDFLEYRDAQGNVLMRHTCAPI